MSLCHGRILIMRHKSQRGSSLTVTSQLSAAKHAQPGPGKGPGAGGKSNQVCSRGGAWEDLNVSIWVPPPPDPQNHSKRAKTRSEPEGPSSETVELSMGACQCGTRKSTTHPKKKIYLCHFFLVSWLSSASGHLGVPGGQGTMGPGGGQGGVGNSDFRDSSVEPA